MPNWCGNVLTVEGSEVDVQRFIAENSDPLAPAESERILSFEMASPTPAETLTPGNDAWYDWRTEHWGTKWNASGAQPWELTTYGELGISARTEFSTAWSSPDGWMETIAPRYPLLMIQLDYVEHGMGFCGSIIAEGGDVFHDEKDYDPADYGYGEGESEEDAGEG